MYFRSASATWNMGFPLVKSRPLPGATLLIEFSSELTLMDPSNMKFSQVIPKPVEKSICPEALLV